MVNRQTGLCMCLPDRPDLWWSFCELWQWAWFYRAWLFSTPHRTRRYSSRSWGEETKCTVSHRQRTTRRHTCKLFSFFFFFTSSDSERNSCMMSLSPITRTEHTGDGKQTVCLGHLDCTLFLSALSTLLVLQKPHTPFSLPDLSPGIPPGLCVVRPTAAPTGKMAISQVAWGT